MRTVSLYSLFAKLYTSGLEVVTQIIYYYKFDITIED